MTSISSIDVICLHVTTDHLSHFANMTTTVQMRRLPKQAMCVQTEGVTDDLKQQLRQQISNELLTEGIEKFIQSYQALSQ